MTFWRRAEPANPVADELRAQLAAERQRVDDLLRQIAELRREGFSPPPPQFEMEPVDGLPSEVMAAIDQRGMTRQSREKLLQYAQRHTRNGSDPSEVAQAILDGDRNFSWGA